MSDKILTRELYRGDMLDVASLLRPESFRLIYLDPPFLTGRARIGSNEDYSYDDKWNSLLDDYLPWLQTRIKALRPLLLSNGSLILHLDFRAAHYAKIMLDEIFGRECFINEIIWHYTGGGRSRNRFSCKHDTLLWYSNGQKPLFNIDAARMPYKKTSGYAKNGIKSASGRIYKPHPDGTPVDDVWDIPIINPMSKERVGYPTQKPVKLLNRIIATLSAENELIGDFCCGSGTTLFCAEKTNRRWIGVDQSKAAIECTLSRFTEVIRKKISIQNL
ncbi:MAG: DNA-methyltransferase [Candidatus Rifleibacteriota bacterium]